MLFGRRCETLKDVKTYALDSELDEYLSYISIDRRLSKETVKSYSYELKEFRAFLIKNKITSIRDVTLKDIENYLKASSYLDNRSLAHRITAIKGFYKFLFLTGYIEKDITCNLIGPKLEKKLPDVLSVNEVDYLLDIHLETVYDYRNKAILELLYASGIRISEALSIKLNDVSFDSCTIRIFGKGGKERIIPLGDVAIEHIKNYLERRNELDKKRSDILFLNSRGDKLSRVGFFKNLQDILREKNVNKKVTPHMLRHSFATHMIEYGADLRVVQELLGHTDISTTRIYTHITNKKIEEDYELYHPRIEEEVE